MSPEGGSSSALVSPYAAGFTQNAIPDRLPETVRVPNTHARCGEMPARHQRKNIPLFAFFHACFSSVSCLGKTYFSSWSVIKSRLSERPLFHPQISETMRHLSYNKKSCRMTVGLVELISTSLSEI
jgi:hypothetical protein